MDDAPGGTRRRVRPAIPRGMGKVSKRVMEAARRGITRSAARGGGVVGRAAACTACRSTASERLEIKRDQRPVAVGAIPSHSPTEEPADADISVPHADPDLAVSGPPCDRGACPAWFPLTLTSRGFGR